jgi:Proteasome subunit A N-terminal signature
VQYDYDVTYSPDGKIFQTEYAQKAVDSSQCAPTYVTYIVYVQGCAHCIAGAQSRCMLEMSCRQTRMHTYAPIYMCYALQNGSRLEV